MDCSKGTYVRTVFHDLGQNLGCGGHLTSLRRTKINDFSIEGVSTLEEIEHMGTGNFSLCLYPFTKLFRHMFFNLWGYFPLSNS